MTRVEQSAPVAGRLAYWRLPRGERMVVRRIEATGRAVGDARLDAIALGRLRRAARRERRLGPFRLPAHGRLPAADRLARLCSTLRHPSRTGACDPGRLAAGTRAPARPTRPRTS